MIETIIFLSYLIIPIWDMCCPSGYEAYNQVDWDDESVVIELLIIYGVAPPLTISIIMMLCILIFLFWKLLTLGVVFIFVYVYILKNKKDS